MPPALSASQVAVVNIALGVAKKLNAPYVAQMALIYAAGGESGFSANNTWGSNNPADTATEAAQFLLGTGDFSNGGAIALAKTSSDIPGIANAVENNGTYEAAGGNSSAGIIPGADSYAIHAYSGIGGQAGGMAWARAIVAQYGSGAAIPKGGVAGLGGTGTAAAAQNPYQFTIGQTGSPNESYWTGINRLAAQVSWYLFSDSEYLYYMDGADLISQTPADYIDRIGDAERIQHLSLTYDNTAFTYASTHRHKGRVQRRTRLAHVTSPTEARLDIICPIDFYRGGDVVVLQNCGPGDGRWLVADCTRSVFSPFSSLTLVPPIMPLSEVQAVGPAASGGAAGTSVVNPATGEAVAIKGGMTNPTPGATYSRTDEGVDGTSQTFVALWSGTVVVSDQSNPGWAGGGYLAIKNASGEVWYLAEGITPTVQVGQQVQVGQTVATPRPNPYNGISGNFEQGYADPANPGNPLDHFGGITPAGQRFRALLNSLGANAGPDHG